MHTSYKRYWEPSTTQTIGSSLVVGAISTALTYPIDFVKTRIQSRAEGIGIRLKGYRAGYNPFLEFRRIHETGRGFSHFYTGLEAALVSRSVYLLTRNLIYKIIYDYTKPAKPSNDLTYREKSVLAGVAGTVAAIVSNPFEVITVRQQIDSALPKEIRRNYAGVMDAYNQIGAREGTAAYFKGVQASIWRSLVLNTALSLPYNFINESFWITFGDCIWNRPIALVLATSFATLFAVPFDNIKTRLQKAFPDPSLNRLNYKGFLDCAHKISLQENAYSFLVGYHAYWLRTFFYAGSTIVLMDVLTTRWKRNAGLKEWQI